jgi:glycosyltransferase involved in cell wall biosynthesis
LALEKGAAQVRSGCQTNREMLKLSLIIPTYNRPHDIRRLLTNLNLQVRKPDEVIIVDASDNTDTEKIVGEEIKRFSYPIHYYRHEKGLTRQRNFGISQAKYEIIGFSDDDSIYEPDYLDKILTIFIEDVDREIAGASGFIFQTDRSRIPEINDVLKNVTDRTEFSCVMKPFANEVLERRRSKVRELIESLLHVRGEKEKEGTYCPVRGKFYGFKSPFVGRKSVDFLVGIAFYRREIFNHVKYSEFFAGYGYAEDVHLSLQVGKKGNLVVDGEASAYHLHAPSGRPKLFNLGFMTAVNLFYIFRTFKRRSLLSYMGFWYFFYVEALLDFVPAFVGRNTGARLKLFGGRCYGPIIVLVDSIRKNKKLRIAGSKLKEHY